MGYTIKKDIEKVLNYDVLIAGGGTSGVIAGISAAREGLKVLVIERMNALGGTQTFSLVTPLMEPGIPGKEAVSSSIGEEIRQKMINKGHCDWMWFDPEMLKFVLEDVLIESGAEVIYQSEVIDIIKDGQEIKAAIIYTGTDFVAVEARCFIDCTGDADMAIQAGCKYHSGNSKGTNQSASLRFEMSGVDIEKVSEYLKRTEQKIWLEYPKLQLCSVDGGMSEDFKMRAKNACTGGELTPLDISHLQMFSVPGRKDTINFNCPEIGADKNVIEAMNLTKRMIEGRKAIERIAGFMKNEIPGFENAYISNTASMAGIRESNRIDAEYQCTSEDIVNYHKFNDGILMSNYKIDIHGASEELGRSISYKDIPESEMYFELPYRSIVAKGVDNLLVCGRCAGMDFYAQSALRVQFCCQAMGEAAGIAAAAVIKNNISCREVDGTKVRNIMKERGASL